MNPAGLVGLRALAATNIKYTAVKYNARIIFNQLISFSKTLIFGLDRSNAVVLQSVQKNDYFEPIHFL